MTTPVWLAEAEKHFGYHEGPNNDTPFGRHFNLNHEPWCDMFVAYCCEVSGHPQPSMQAGMPTGAAAVVDSITYAKAHGLWIPSWQAKAGDQICYGWNGPNSTPENMHTGFIVSSGPKGSVGHTIEGNRGDQVGRFTFTVGDATVLGAVDLNRLLKGRPKVVVHKPQQVKPKPQPRNKQHPAHTGPPQPDVYRLLNQDLGKLPPRIAEQFEKELRKVRPHVSIDPKDRKMTTPKPGFKSSEFYAHLITQVVAILGLVGQFNTTSPLGNSLIKIAALLASAGAAAGYANARGKAKAATKPS